MTPASKQGPDVTGGDCTPRTTVAPLSPKAPGTAVHAAATAKMQTSVARNVFGRFASPTSQVATGRPAERARACRSQRHLACIRGKSLLPLPPGSQGCRVSHQASRPKDPGELTDEGLERSLRRRVRGDARAQELLDALAGRLW